VTEQRGVFITFEGGEGCGKSTQQRLLMRRLETAGLTVRSLREPGGTVVGEAVRSVLLDPEHAGLDATAEVLLYEAARAQLVAEVIEPALAAGEVVLCDRFFDSSTAYQGHARGLPLAQIESLNRIATGGLLPDRTLLLDIDAALGVQRATCEGGADRLECEDIAFHERVRQGFLRVAAENPGRFRIIDADADVETVAARITEALRDILPEADASHGSPA